MKNITNLLCIAALFCAGAFWPVQAQPAVFKVLHGFSADSHPANSDGVSPEGALVLSGNTLYGTAIAGGTAGNGAVFAVTTNGSGFTNLHSFTALNHTTYANSDGAVPQAALVLSGNTLYGTATTGGKAAYGTVFAVNTDGKGFVTLYSFTNGSDGAFPQCGLVLSGDTLYGTAEQGGSANTGTVFALRTNGTGFTTLYDFTAMSDPFFGTNADGALPIDGLVLSGSTLYGTATGGGGNGNGTMFAVNTNGTGFTIVHDFTAALGPDGTNNDGLEPNGDLILAGNMLYGTAYGGGGEGYGTVFAVNIDGSGFTNLHSFTAFLDPEDAANSDGALPFAGLMLSSNTLYGTTQKGGSGGNGTVFAVNTDGSDFTNLYDFTATSGAEPSTNNDGTYPDAGLIFAANTLYGTASEGGPAGNGTVFSLLLGPPVAPFITTNPVSQIVGVGSNVMLQVAAIGSNTLTYQWLFNRAKLANGSHVSGATSDALTLESVAAANAGSYAVIVSNSYGSATSAVATVSVLTAPHITTQPVTQSVPTNGLAAFSVKASGALLSYQWFFDGQPLSDGGNISGSATNQLTINPATAGDLGSYSVVVSNAANSVTSNPARLALVPEKTKPSVAITSPKANSRTNNPSLIGTASDSVGVESVGFWVVNMNNGVPTTNSGVAALASGSGSVSNWGIATTLLPGTNILTVRSSNYSGLASPVESATFFYIVPSMFTLTTNGPGGVTGSAFVVKDFAPTNGAMLNIGERYSLTAHPSNNFLLSNWVSASFTSNAPTLDFIMEPNLAITANFTANLFTGMAGRYDGIFYPSGSQGATEETSGLIENLRFGSNGVYSGKLYLAGTTSSLSGAFDSSGQTSEPLGRIAAAGGNVTLQLTLLFQSAPRQITGMVLGTGWTAGNLNLYAATTNLNNGTNYTLLLPQYLDVPGVPPSYGYALITNTGSMINMGGVLSDGTPFSRSEPINEQNGFPVYASLYSNTGLLLGSLSLEVGLGGPPAPPAPGSTIGLSLIGFHYGGVLPVAPPLPSEVVRLPLLTWIKPAQKSGLYTNGFDTPLDVDLSLWANSALVVTNLFPDGALLTFSGGGLSSNLVYQVQLTQTNTLKFTSGPTNFASGSFNRANGQMTLTFTPTGGKKVTVSGALLQNPNLGGGFFLGATNAGTIELSPPGPVTGDNALDTAQ